MKRVTGWEKRLTAFLRSKQNEPFIWGASDCALFTCDAIREITGIDVAAEFRGKYSTELGAAKVIRKFCGGNLEQLAEKVARQFSLAEVPAMSAQRGDAVLLDLENPQLGIVSMDGWNVATFYVSGKQACTLRDCRRAWRVG